MSSSPKAEEVNDEPAAVANSSLSAENTLDDQPDEQQDYVDLIDSVEKDPQACSGTTSEADPDPNTEKPAARRTPLTGVGRLLRHARVALFWLQGLGETVDESDVAGVVCQWLGKLDNPGDSVSLDESIALDSLREVLRQVAARQGRECVRCGEVFEEEFNAWTCKKFLDNHYSRLTISSPFPTRSLSLSASTGSSSYWSTSELTHDGNICRW